MTEDTSRIVEALRRGAVRQRVESDRVFRAGNRAEAFGNPKSLRMRKVSAEKLAMADVMERAADLLTHPAPPVGVPDEWREAMHGLVDYMHEAGMPCERAERLLFAALAACTPAKSEGR